MSIRPPEVDHSPETGSSAVTCGGAYEMPGSVAADVSPMTVTTQLRFAPDPGGDVQDTWLCAWLTKQSRMAMTSGVGSREVHLTTGAELLNCGPKCSPTKTTVSPPAVLIWLLSKPPARTMWALLSSGSAYDLRSTRGER